ncbi:hypothetical protein TetV_505 [Tetraselmis virus 1]|uniref:Uncharacterized protein n=1 Tax=Tetraselmis virus 1 TaxID=2060617 RepID=A0A2P0VNV6_9VIRU|nr:hypothetical protein QJ968_gp549 [Tetraselmis virus 1]AUF82587.1 hypothetical protein TetV_505 [Tetraselmis virus 1]
MLGHAINAAIVCNKLSSTPVSKRIYKISIKPTPLFSKVELSTENSLCNLLSVTKSVGLQVAYPETAQAKPDSPIYRDVTSLDEETYYVLVRDYISRD